MGFRMQLWLEFLLHLVLQQYQVLLLALPEQLVPLDLRQVLLVDGDEVLLALVLVWQLPGLVQSVKVTRLLRLVLLPVL